MQLDGYLRVSAVRGRDVEAESYRTERDQREAIERWAAREGHEVIAWHVERDVSGRKMSRPKFNLAMRRIEHHETGGVVVAYRSRFGRTMLGSLQAIQRIEAAGGVALAADGFDGRTPEGRLAIGIMMLFAEYELERIDGNWRAAQSAAVARGIHIGIAPRGYMRLGPPRVEGGSPTGPLVPDPEWGPKVTEAFRRKAAGESLGALADRLGITVPSVRKMLSNRTYLGIARGPRGLENPNAHPPLVDADTFALCTPGRYGERSSAAPVRVLGGLVRCAGCGYAMASVGGSGARGVDAYACRGRHAGGRCTATAGVTERLLNAWVANQVDLAMADPQHPGYAPVRAVLDGGDEWAASKQAVEVAEAELRAFVVGAAALRADLFAAGVEAREQAVAEARRRLAAAPEASRAWWEGNTQPMTAGEFDARDTKALYRRLIERVEVGRARDRVGRDLGERCRIVWRGQDEAAPALESRRVAGDRRRVGGCPVVMDRVPLPGEVVARPERGDALPRASWEAPGGSLDATC